MSDLVSLAVGLISGGVIGGLVGHAAGFRLGWRIGRLAVRQVAPAPDLPGPSRYDLDREELRRAFDRSPRQRGRS